MDVQQSLSAWQEIARYRAARKLLRGNAIGSLIFGAIAVIAGGRYFLLYFVVNPVVGAIGLVLAGVGLFLLVGAILSFASPGPAALIISGISLIVLGLWNVFNTISAAAIAKQSGPFNTMWAILGVWQIIWGVKMLRPKSRHAAIGLTPPAPEALKELDSMAAGVKGAREKSGPEFVEFTVSSPEAMMLRGKLMPEWALFSDQSGTHLFFAAPPDIDLKLKKEGPLTKRNKCEMTLGGEKMVCSVPELSFQRILAWKAGPSGPVPPVAGGGIDSTSHDGSVAAS